MAASAETQEDRLYSGVMELVRRIRDDYSYSNAKLVTQRQARARSLAEHVAEYWGVEVKALARATAELMGDITGIDTHEKARVATFEEAAEARAERLAVNERLGR